MSASSLLIVLRVYALSNTPTFPNQTFTDVARIAIWNRNKVAMGIGISVWGVNAVGFLQCKSLLPLLWIIATKLHINVDEYSGCTCAYSIPNMLNRVLIPP